MKIQIAFGLNTDVSPITFLFEPSSNGIGQNRQTIFLINTDMGDLIGGICS